MSPAPAGPPDCLRTTMARVPRKGWMGALLALSAVGIAPGEEPTATSAPKPEPPRAALRSLTLFPKEIDRAGPRGGRGGGIMGKYGEGRWWARGGAEKLRVHPPHLAVVDKHGVVRPLADGQGVVAVQAG